MSSLVQLAPGSVFAGEFRIVRPLSEGGMGAVYVVEQTSTGKQRALKIMHPGLVNDESLRARFVQEARIGAKIDSDHVVEVVAAGIEPSTGTPWLIMELLQGETLAGRVDTMGPRHLAEVREILGQLCHALAAAHRVGIVHRDLKPENIFLAIARREGVPFNLKVLDFGIAKLVAESETRQTAAMGSPLWMAPEQADLGGAISARTDVWALGLIVFYMLTGKEYWRGAHAESPNPVQLVTEMKFLPLVSASERAAEYFRQDKLPTNFDAWFSRCVTREPKDRFADAREARLAFEEATGHVPPPRSLQPAPHPNERSPHPATPAPYPTAISAPSGAKLEVPDLDFDARPSAAPRTSSTGKQQAVKIREKTAENASKSGPMPAVGSSESDVTSSASNVMSPTSNVMPRGTSTTSTAVPSALDASSSAKSSGTHPSVARGAEPPPSEPPPMDPLAQQPTVPRSSTSRRSRASHSIPRASEGRGSIATSWWKWALLGVGALAVIWFVLHMLIIAAEKSASSGAATDRGAAATTAASTATPTAPISCAGGMIALTGGAFEGASGKVVVESFCMDKTEVTVKDYITCVRDKKCTPARKQGNWPAPNAEQTALYDKTCNGERLDRLSHPVNCVDAAQADAFCAAQGKQLPTEAQWEWAARGKAERWPYPWGKDAPDNHLCWSQFTHRSGTCAVGGYPRGDDPWGVEDLDGNVREWLRAEMGGKDREYCGADWTDTRETFHALGACAFTRTDAASGFLGFRCVK